MDLIFAVIVFVLFSVIGDAIEGRKKKRRMPPPEGKNPEQGKAEFEIPPIYGAPGSRRPEVQEETPARKANSQAMNSYLETLQKRAQEQKKAALSAAPAAPTSSAASPIYNAAPDMHTDILLHAIEYAQILQPPKAYQYIATRSCRGDWGNQR